MAAKTTDLSVLAESLARTFGTPALSVSQLANPDRLHEALEAAGARVTLWSRYADRITAATDERILAENADTGFWESRSLIVAPSVSFDAAGEFANQCFVVEGPTTPADLLAWYRANVRSVLFDVDTVIFAESAKRVLVAAHYGSVALYEPKSDRT
jgi:hypothetical protein